jgi:hypothetical protein
MNSLVKDYGRNSLSTDGGIWYSYMIVNSSEDKTSYIDSTYMREKHY